MVKSNPKNLSLTHLALGTLLSDLARLPSGYKGKSQYVPGSAMAQKQKQLAVQKDRSAKRAALRPAGRTTEFTAPTMFGSSSDSLVRTQVVSSSLNSSVMRGTSILGPVQTGPNSPTGPQAVFSCSSNPVTFPDRMGILAQTYDKYVYKKCCLRYVPACATTQPGMIIIGIDRDYMDPPNTGGIAQTMSYEAVASGSVWASHKCNMMRDNHEKRDYYTNFTASTELRESEQFRFWAYAANAASSTTLGYLYIDYEIEMISPVYAPQEIASNLASLQCQNGAFTISFAANSNIPTITTSGLNVPLPAFGASAGNIFEILISSNITNTGFKIGSATGPDYNPPTSQIFYLRCNNAGTGWALFLDYPSALTNSAIVSSVYNNTAAISALCTSARGVVRQIQGTNSGA